MIKTMNMAAIRKLFAALVILSLAALIACSSKKNEANAHAEGNANRAPEQVEVATAPVVERNTRRGIEVVGSLEAEDEVTLSSQASGNLDEIAVDIGTPVRRGQVIGHIDRREVNLKVEQAEATLRQAEARLGVQGGAKLDLQKQSDVRQAKAALDRARYDLNAAKNLVENGDISKQQQDVYQKTFEQAEARYQAALENVRNLEAQIEEKRAALALARKLLTDTAIISPINGVVKEKLASRGEYLQPGKPVVTIVQINPLRLKLEVPEIFAANIGRGQAVTLKVDSFADREFKGVINRINPSVDEKNRSLMAEAEVMNEGGLLRPGMFARAQVVSQSSGVALMVPEKAVVSLAGINKVFVVEGDHAAERLVKLGARDGSLVEIIEGVKLGDKVITSNTEKLHDGMNVSAS
ncbi:MAG TPA: efflux RND transporter periplasmic adaptor subunit [Blastocatellia bacterium]|nr:efflux RND transporter periplasmic adaptor subunit [Blastocatellia bacterium]